MNTFNNGKWICSNEFVDERPVDLFHKQLDKRDVELPEHLQNIHMLVKKRFLVSNTEARSLIRITADDYYKLYINGRFVCQGPAQGYYFCYYWNEMDITDYLNEGENEIFVDVSEAYK